MSKDFWLREIAKHATLDGDVLTIQPEPDGRIELNALEIKFRDGECCMLIGAEQIDAEAKYNLNSGRCLEATVDGDLLRWQEEYFDSFSPRDPNTGKADYEQEFTGVRVRGIARRLEDIAGIQTYALYEMNFDVFDSDPEE
jgi:hypothetical protein